MSYVNRFFGCVSRCCGHYNYDYLPLVFA